MREREEQSSPRPVNPTTIPWAAHELAIQELTKRYEAEKGELQKRIAELEAAAAKPVEAHETEKGEPQKRKR
jgi:hypothetical protein